MYYDADYIRALEYGLRPRPEKASGSTALVMLFTNSRAFATCCCFPICARKPKPSATVETLCYINRLVPRALLRVGFEPCNRRPSWKRKPHVIPSLLIVAAIAITLFSLVGIGAVLGWIPTSVGTPGAATTPAAQAPEQPPRSPPSRSLR